MPIHSNLPLIQHFQVLFPSGSPPEPRTPVVGPECFSVSKRFFLNVCWDFDFCVSLFPVGVSHYALKAQEKS